MLAWCPTLLAVAHLYTVHPYAVPQSWNYGAGAECDWQSGVAVQTGAYRNSWNRLTTYGVAGYDYWLGPVSVGAFAGAASGYHPSPKVVAGARVQYRLRPVVLGAEVLPPDDSRASWGEVHFTVALQVAP